jgi:chromosome segregation ATPase
VTPDACASADDDGIVVVMHFDWDTFDARVDDVARRMRGVSERMTRQIAESQAARARYEQQRGTVGIVRESPPPAEDEPIHGRLDRLERALNRIGEDVSGVQRELGAVRGELLEIKERRATKVELEALQHDIRIVADGFAQTQSRLSEVKGLMVRHLPSA